MNLARGFARVSTTAAISAVLYWLWLTTPVLDYWSRTEWCAVAMVIAVGLGAIGALRKWNIAGMAGGAASGMLMSGTWLGWRYTDVSTSLVYALKSHLEGFWHEISLLTIVAAAGALCTARLVRLRART